jgi:hypothetical protein
VGSKEWGMGSKKLFHDSPLPIPYSPSSILQSTIRNLVN